MSDDKEPVGSVGEEALKLFQALQDAARESGAGSVGESAASVFATVNEHIATGGAECRYCPLCQVISAVREVSPEVKAHLGAAGASLLQAAAAAMATVGADRTDRSESPVEKIDLSDGAWDDELGDEPD